MRFFGLFHRARREREFAEELESHLAMHIEDNLRAGMSPEEARRVALSKLGGVTLTKELRREQGGLPMLETLLLDLRFGLRMLWKNKGFTAGAFLGRNVTEEDDKVPGAHPVVVISHGYWRRRFASDPAIVGKSISLNGHPFTIIGVTPPEFFGAVVGETPDLWAPMMMMIAQLNPGSSINQYFNNPVYPVLARLKPEASEQQARAADRAFAPNGAGGDRN